MALTTSQATYLQDLSESGLRRHRRLGASASGPVCRMDGHDVLLLCSNNYLGFADDPRIRAASQEAAERYGNGCGAAPLVSGYTELHRQLE